MYSTKTSIVDELINVVKRFSENHRENVLHSVAQCFEAGEALCAAKLRSLPTPSIKCNILLLTIKNPLFPNILVYYFSFFVIITINKEPPKISKCINTLYSRLATRDVIIMPFDVIITAHFLSRVSLYNVHFLIVILMKFFLRHFLKLR